MFRIPSFVWLAVLACGVWLGLAGPVQAQFGHHGGHHHGFSLGHHHHGGYARIQIGHHAGYGYYGAYYPSTIRYYGTTPYQYAYPYVGSSYYPSYTTAANPTTARVEVFVPDPEAQVWVDGSPTSSRGMTRAFESPPLKAGQSYTYTLRATWNVKGQAVTEERTVSVAAGQTSVADFTRPPPPEKIGAPK